MLQIRMICTVIGIVAALGWGPAFAQQTPGTTAVPEDNATTPRGGEDNTSSDTSRTAAPTTPSPLMPQDLPATELPQTEMPSSDLPASDMPQSQE
jgi:cytoskeletal protein RodZ